MSFRYAAWDALMAALIFEHQRGMEAYLTPPSDLINQWLEMVKTGTRQEFKTLLSRARESDDLEHLVAAEYRRQEGRIFEQTLNTVGGSFRMLLTVYTARLGWLAKCRYYKYGNDIGAAQEIEGRVVARATGLSKAIAGEKVSEMVLHELRQVESLADNRVLLSCYAGTKSPPIELTEYLESKPLSIPPEN